MLNVRLTSFLRPIVKSALKLFIVSILCNLLLIYADPSYHIRANRGIGKIVFTGLVLIQLFNLLRHCSLATQKAFFRKNILFLYYDRWVSGFFLFFLLFFGLHALVLTVLLAGGYASWVTPSAALIISLWKTLAVGGIATFFLALTEEVIFRGALYTYCSTYFSPLTSALLTSICFSLAHNLYNPLVLVTSELSLGIGLFLLGLLLNLILIKTEKIYYAMGAHAGLVFLKVLLRKIPCFTFASNSELPWYITPDLRAAPVVHLLFFVALAMLLLNLRKLTKNKQASWE